MSKKSEKQGYDYSMIENSLSYDTFPTSSALLPKRNTSRQQPRGKKYGIRSNSRDK